MNFELSDLQKAVVYQQGAIIATLKAMKETTPAITFNLFLKVFTQDFLEKVKDVTARGEL